MIHNNISIVNLFRSELPLFHLTLLALLPLTHTTSSVCAAGNGRPDDRIRRTMGSVESRLPVSSDNSQTSSADVPTLRLMMLSIRSRGGPELSFMPFLGGPAGNG